MFKVIYSNAIFVLLSLSVLGTTSCAPVKFSKADNVVVDTGIGANKAVLCDPKVNGGSEFTYTDAGTLPHIVSQCTPTTKNLDYTWTVKKADGSIISTVIPGLTGKDPQSVNFRDSLGQGVYFVYLKAVDPTSEYSAFNSTTPLKFTVPGAPPTPMTCHPQLNGSLMDVVVAPSDANPSVAANCDPLAATYTWKVYKGTQLVTVPQLGGSTSANPNFKSLGVGDYRIYLYAIHESGSTWETQGNPLTVKVTDDVNPPDETIQCNPRINGSLTNLTITPSSQNPLISANCLPNSVQYSWTVTKNGQTIQVPGLTGSNSNPNFGSLGEGTYLIYLSATKPNSQPWNATQPLMITVEGPGDGQLTLNCQPRLNDVFVSITVAPTGQNPKVSSGCNPQSVTHSWTVVKNGQTITLPGLAGSVSTPNFIGTGNGTYLVYLTASAPGYNTYVSPSPLEVTVGNLGPEVRHVTYTKNVTVTDNKVDILLVVDDSNSMLPENTKLAQKLKGFVDDLQAAGLDWQMCTTVTRAQNISNTLYWGASKNWINYVGSPQWVLKAGATDPYSIFTNTIQTIGAGWAGTDDERAIKSAYWHAEYADYNKCYRSDASLAVIILSDEDERSVGGNMALQYYYNEFKTLEADDYPQAYVNKIKQKFGAQKNLSVNSIIVKPGDDSCMTTQDAGGAKSHFGFKYKELSDLTRGYTGSICDADYSNSLYYFKDKIISSLSSVPLECAPVGQVQVSIIPTMGGLTSQVVNNSLVFTPAIPAGRTVTVDYDCPVH